MDARLTSRAAVPPSPPSISEYASDQAKIGKRSLPGAPGTFWARHLPGIFERIPAVYLEPPSPNEVRDVLLRGRAMLAIYFMEPDEHHPVNAWVYVCTDQAYALDQRPKAFRWAVRRGLSELRV